MMSCRHTYPAKRKALHNKPLVGPRKDMVNFMWLAALPGLWKLDGMGRYSQYWEGGAI
jgi:hypothetical protein